jgi:hypothetical protein
MEQQDFLDSQVSLFKNVTDRAPKVVSLRKVLLGETYKQEVEAVRAADGEQQQLLKRQLPCLAVSAICDGGHAAENVMQQTDLICIDFDAKDNTHLDNFNKLKELIAAIPFVGYCGLSCRGKGFFVIIPIAAPYRFADQYRAAVEYFKQYGLQADAQCKDITRLRFVSFDPQPYINEHPTAFDLVFEEEAEEPKQQETTAKGILEATEAIKATARIVDYINAAKAAETPIADNYEDWQKMAFAFATSFGEAGRDLFHRYAALSSKYDYEQTDRKFSNALAHGRDKVTIASFFNLCKTKGVAAAMDFNDIEY